jgi:hypothetical protein
MPCADVAIAVGIVELLRIHDDEGAYAKKRELLYNVSPEPASPDHADTRSLYALLTVMTKEPDAAVETLIVVH